MSCSVQKPPFKPYPLNLNKQEQDNNNNNNNNTWPLHDASDQQKWLPVVACNSNLAMSAFSSAIIEFIKHPERNSSFILRGEILSEQTDISQNQISNFLCKNEETKQLIDLLSSDFVEQDNAYSFSYYKRKLVPKRAHDGPLDQTCLLIQNQQKQHGLVVLLPHYTRQCDTSDNNLREQEHEQEQGNETSSKIKIPFYHPQVAALAIRYKHLKDGDDENNFQLSLEYLTHPDYPIPIDALKNTLQTDSRVYRTALALLQNVFRYVAGKVAGYVKRVNHDLIVPRNDFQDLYIKMKSRWSWVCSEWPESTDPQKHVFEDIGIATFLISLWRIMFKDGKPPGGFVDLGTGNGLLVHILSQEGYQGYGIDLRARKSWKFWFQKAKESGIPTRLIERTLDAPRIVQEQESEFDSGSFFIGNHADEMTPWVPLIASITPDSTFLNIPCCLHTLSGRFTNNSHNVSSNLLEQIPDCSKWLNDFNSITSEGGGRYNAYQRYLFELTVQAGYIPEREALRIPSVGSHFSSSYDDPHPGALLKNLRTSVLTKPFIQTRNIAILGRHRHDSFNFETVKSLAQQASVDFKPRPSEKATQDH